MTAEDAARAIATVTLTLAAIVIGPVAVAAAAPNLAIEQPVTGSTSNNDLPVFSGSSEDELNPVTVKLYAGTSAEGEPVSALVTTLPPFGGKWEVAEEAPLEQGQYTAVAEQEAEGEPATSEAVTFTIDTTAPAVSISPAVSPTNDASPTLSGDLGTEVGDSNAVSVTIYRGAAASGEVASTGEAAVGGSSWSYTPSHLADGTYTAQATQQDEAGNTGASLATTFTVDTIAPTVAIVAPAQGAVLNASRTTFSGLAGQAAGDSASIELKIYAGTSVSGVPAQTLELTSSAGGWTTGAGSPALMNGVYTVLAEQSDAAGNVGTGTVTFTIEASSPVVTLDTSAFTRRGGTFVTDATPSFTGSASTGPEDSDTVLVKIFSGTSTSVSPVSSMEGTLSGSKWHAGPTDALPSGTYTALAEQADSNPFSKSTDATATFTVDGHAPAVTLTAPADGSSTSASSEPLGGAAGTAEGDSPTVTIQLYAGSKAVGSPLEAVSVQATGAAWSAAVGGLTPGTYTARAEQLDDVGNVGHSAPTTFTVTSTTPAASPVPPVASFQWFPVTPRVGEPVSLVSTSTDAFSPLTTFAWSLAGNETFEAIGSTLTTSFSTPGPHDVQLFVADANGQSDVVTETITAISPAPTLMQPFPVVRIAGSAGSSGTRISLLTVQAPIGASVSVVCHGRGCPAKRRDLVSASRPSKGKTGLSLITFRRFERLLHAGAYLRIGIYAPGQIGKFTRFTVRHGKLPARVDTCLSPDGVKPMTCPS